MPGENPILNNPYEEPVLHYGTNPEGEIDYEHVLPGRRAYRRELAKSNGETHFLFRPSYANVAGQVPLPTAKIPV